MKVLYVSCPKCGCHYLAILVLGECFVQTECIRCLNKQRFNKEDVEDKIIEHE